jgi:hypothetical protein
MSASGGDCEPNKNATSGNTLVCISNVAIELVKPELYKMLGKHFTLRKARAATGLLRGLTLRFVKTAARTVDICARMVDKASTQDSKSMSEQVRELNFDAQAGSAALICCIRADVCDWDCICEVQADLHPSVQIMFYNDNIDFIRLLLRQIRAHENSIQATVDASCQQQPAASLDTESTARLIADCVADSSDAPSASAALQFDIVTALHGLGSVQHLAASDVDKLAERSTLSADAAVAVHRFIHAGDQHSHRFV